MSPLQPRETSIEVEDGFRVWAMELGGGSVDDRPALLVLHGGPGGTHEYLSNLAALASESQRVVFYDQLGCGKSDQPDDPGRWKIPRFVQELATVRNVLHLEEVIILGQSWGGMLAIEYLLTKPEGVRGLILSNSLSSAPIFASELLRLKNELPTPIKTALKQNESNGTLDSEAYKKAVEAFYSRHILRMDPLPEQLLEVLNSENQVYQVMWGSNEFNFTGNLKDWDRSKDLSRIELPTLIISGEFDESTPLVNEALQKGLKNSEWILMPGCSHLPNLENPEAYLQHIRLFLHRISKSQ